MAASYLNQPVELEASRGRLAVAARAAGVPQLLLRFGYGPPVRPTPRRGVEEVFIPQSEASQPSGAAPER
ncbi:MAG: hypothetical protein E2O39_01415 [Planctomycetota bacterium]|nr:MAG: hypothetical protein E2O39_01415 [Planctomycetota bacterium]